MITATTPQPKDALYTNGASDTPHVMTWDEYIHEPTVYRRYDIVEGVRYFMSAPKLGHQRIALRITVLLEQYEARTQSGLIFPAPCDVLIRRTPRIQTRQPDGLFVTNNRLTQQTDYDDAGYLSVPPNLVVEILSDSDRKGVIAAKLADYFTIGVDEIWIVRPDERTVSVLTRGIADYETAAPVNETDTLTSATLPGLSVSVADIFAA